MNVMKQTNETHKNINTDKNESNKHQHVIIVPSHHCARHTLDSLRLYKQLARQLSWFVIETVTSTLG